MLKKKQRNYYGIIVLVFIVMNTVNTYFLTSQFLNKYIAPLSRTFIGEITAIVGNVGVLALLLVIGFSIFKKDKNKFIYLTSVTLFLNLFIFALGFFNLFYSTAFSVNALGNFKNPSEGIASGLVTEVFGELFLYYRFLIFVPFVVILFYTIKYSKIVKETTIDTLIRYNPKRYLIMILTVILLIGTASTSYVVQLLNDDFKIGSTSPSKGIQNYGVYPFYITNFLGIEFEFTSRKSLGFKDGQDMVDSYEEFNKNVNSYTSVIDNETYSINLLVKDSIVNTHDSLNLNSDSSLNGIFKDKNLVLVQLESLNYFLWQLPDTKEKFVFLNELFKQSVVFENYYTSVGLGVSSDAEASVLTGLYMNGYSTLYQEYKGRGYELDTLPKLFDDYKSRVFHGGFEKFYNRDNAYPELIGFTEDYYSIEDFASDAGYKDGSSYLSYRKENGKIYPHYKYEDGLNLITPWPSEYEVSDKINAVLDNAVNEKHFIFSVYMTPHTPFLFDPMTENKYDGDAKIKNITRRYIDFASYLDTTFESYFVDPKTGLERENMEDNVYVFYSDHGSSLKNGDLGRLFNKDISLLEERRMLQQTVSFIYAPSSVKTDVNGIHEGLITGKQSLTRGHIDLYRTIGDLFGVFDSSDFYFGVSMLSKEPTYVIDNRIQDLVIDDINNIDKDDYVPFFVSLRNKKFRISKYNTNSIQREDEILSSIKSFKRHSDLLLVDTSVYKDYKKALQNRD